MITPTVGRKVWYRPSANDRMYMAVGGDQPLDATIVAVHNDHCVNLVIFDYNGSMHTRCSAYLAQEGVDVPSWAVSHAEWMPYQQGQAKKSESEAVAPVSDIPPHQQRVIDEHADLSDKVVKLECFLDTVTFNGLPKDEQARLRTQAIAMETYRAILSERIAAFSA